MMLEIISTVHLWTTLTDFRDILQHEDVLLISDLRVDLTKASYLRLLKSGIGREHMANHLERARRGTYHLSGKNKI